MTYVNDRLRAAWRKCELICELDTPAYQAFWLKRVEQNTRTLSCRILFTPEGIVILGDWAPRDGVISVYGYGVEWFAGRLSEDYLCSKFLSREFVSEVALEDLREAVKDRGDYLTEDDAADIEELQRDLESNCLRSVGFAQEWQVIFGDYDGEGWGYNPKVAGLLCAIQQRFACLYHHDLRRVEGGTS